MDSKKSVKPVKLEHLILFTPSVLREQWIRAKYERMEFTGETKYPPLAYTTGELALLLVCGRSNDML